MRGGAMGGSENIPAPSRLRREIGAALVIKLLLLFGLWWLLFRWQDRPQTQPDMAAHLALPSAQAVYSKSITEESDHDR